LADYPQATILEVKTIDGLGTTIDIVLVNGQINEGDTIVVCGMQGPIVTTVRALLTPPVMKEMRVKSDYVHHTVIKAAIGVKLVAAGLDQAVAGTELLIAHPEDEIEDLKAEVMEDFDTIMAGFKRDSVGVYVQASTLGSLEALLEYLRSHKIPVAQVGIGPLHKKDIIAASVMLEKKAEYATILAFDVKITAEAEEAAISMGVKIFKADIIYHLTDQFDAYLRDLVAKKREASEAVFPVIAKIIPTAIYNKKDPIIVGVDVIEGRLKIGTPLCVVLPEDKIITEDILKTGPNVLVIGKVVGIENNHVAVQEVVQGGPSVSCKIEQTDAQTAIMYGRHFDHTNLLYSHITRNSIDTLKEHFMESVRREEWKTMIKLKSLLGVD
jgi:translation initiation factor 5B